MNALIDIRKTLLASTEQAVAMTAGESELIGESKPRGQADSPRDGREEKRRSHPMRHARQRGMGYQKYKQRGGW